MQVNMISSLITTVMNLGALIESFY